MSRSRVAAVFLAFAFSYFFSALLRAVTATLAPSFSAELGLRAADLGLLAGAFFLGFALMQLPLGRALDVVGPRRVIVALLAVAVVGCGCFALARSLPLLIAARVLIGVGVAACLMSPLTCYRRHFAPATQLRANSWMLMTGSLGMLASTLPVQWLLPLWGWRGLFWAVAVALLVAIGVIVSIVPPDGAGQPAAHGDGGYRMVLRHPLFRRMAPVAFLLYGGIIAVQSLWAGPWLTRVAHASPREAAEGLFLINLGMLFTFLAWGLAMPRLVRRGLDAATLMARGLPLSLLLLVANVALGERAGALNWAAWCMSTTVVSLSQPAVGQAFPQALAGRALSAFNLVIFVGVFVLQWGIGLAIDALVAAGWREPEAFRAAFGVYAAACIAAYLVFLLGGSKGADNRVPGTTT